MNDYPKQWYNGSGYTDYAKLCADINTNIVQSVLLNSEDDEAGATEAGFWPLDNCMVTQ